MDVSTALKLILSKEANQCLNITMDSGNPFSPPVNDGTSERAPPNINFCELPSRIMVPTMHTLCCIPVVHGQYWIQFSQVTPLQWINLKLCLVGFPKRVPPLVLCSHVLEKYNHHDGCQPTLELSALSP